MTARAFYRCTTPWLRQLQEPILTEFRNKGMKSRSKIGGKQAARRELGYE